MGKETYEVKMSFMELIALITAGNFRLAQVREWAETDDPEIAAYWTEVANRLEGGAAALQVAKVVVG